MELHLKPVSEQVIVITGASSGIGLVTATEAARRGAKVILAARNEADLRAAVERIRADGGRATFCVADVSSPANVETIASTAIREFGRIDTWVNNAGTALYGRLSEISRNDMRRQFDVDFWGQVHGSLTAVPHLREHGGALINVASVLADRAIPLQGIYAAAKHALKAFTDTLRMELEEEGVPVSVTLVKPSSIDTPLFEKARSYLGVEPRPIRPVYAPEVVARAILTCAEAPVRDIVVGGSGRLLSLSGIAPRVADRLLERTAFTAQCSDVPLGDGHGDNLHDVLPYDGGERGQHREGRGPARPAAPNGSHGDSAGNAMEGGAAALRLDAEANAPRVSGDGVSSSVHRHSLYTSAALHPRATAMVAAAFGLAVVAGLRRRHRDASGRYVEES